MLSVTELTEMQGAHDAALPDLATILRKSATSNGAGGRVETFAAIATNVPCQVVPSQAQTPEGTKEGRYENAQPFTLRFPFGTDITPRDRVTVNGTTYEVAGVARRGAWEIGRRVSVSEVR